MALNKVLTIFLCVLYSLVHGQTCVDSKITFVPDTSHDVHRVMIAGCACATPCGAISTYTALPVLWNVESPHYGETPVIAANTVSPLQCFTFTANNTSENIDMGSVAGCIGFTRFNWSIYDASCTLVTSGTKPNLTANGLVCGNSYTLCITFKNLCVVDSICPYVYNSNCAALPIQLMYFNCEYDGRVVDVDWRTATETNNKQFDVEKTTDGVNYQVVAEVPGSGNSDVEKFYSTEDDDPLNGISYYRLKQTDYDGHFTYSDVVPVSIDMDIVRIFPNPTTGIVNVKYGSSTEKNVTVRVSDMSGRILMSTEFYAQNGANTTVLDLSKFSPGMYMLDIQGHHFKVSKK